MSEVALSPLSGLAELAPIDLDELVARADLQVRQDRKYLVPPAVVDHVVRRHGAELRVLEIDARRSFAYESVYFDTPELDSHLAAARGRPRRFKVRTRVYVDSATAMLEVKTRGRRGDTVKRRWEHDQNERYVLGPRSRRHLSTVEQVAPHVDRLSPRLVTRFHRSTLVMNDDSARVTLDDEVQWISPDGPTLTLPDRLLVETKSAGPPSSLDRALWAAGHRPVRISKYCTGMAALDPSLPSNKWHRTLRVHLDRSA